MSELGEKEKDFCALTRADVAERLLKSHRALILFHVHPDGDAAGSAFALRAFLEDMGKSARCVCADEMPERLLFLSEEQESVLPDTVPADFDADLIVTVDTASPSQMGALFEEFGDRVDLMIDHHGKGTPYADYCVEPDSSASGEVLYEILSLAAEKCGRELSLRVCERLYAAISSDTGCFKYSNTTSVTHGIVAKLLEAGVSHADINHRLFGIKTLKQMQVEHAGFERMNLHCDGRMAVITFPYDLKKQYGAEDEDLETLIDVARCIKGVQIAAVIKQPTAENRFRVSLRSSTDLDVSEIASQYGGGGHKKAAGCTVMADSILSAEMTVVMVVEQKLN